MFKNKEVLKEAGLTPYERKCIYDTIMDTIGNGENSELDLEIIEFNVKVRFDHMIDHDFDWDDEELDPADNEYIVITSVEIFDTNKLLQEAGIEYENSAGGSFYFKFAGEEYRVSDHKRPAYQDTGGAWHDHEYANNYVCGNQIEVYETVEMLLKYK